PPRPCASSSADPAASDPGCACRKVPGGGRLVGSMDSFSPLLDRALSHARSWISSLDKRPVRPTASLDALTEAFGGELPEEGQDPAAVLDLLASAGEPGLMATAGPRFFGFVIGGRPPVPLAARRRAPA